MINKTTQNKLIQLTHNVEFIQCYKRILGEGVDLELKELIDGTWAFIPYFPDDYRYFEEELDLSDYNDTLVRIVSGR